MRQECHINDGRAGCRVLRELDLKAIADVHCAAYLTAQEDADDFS